MALVGVEVYAPVVTSGLPLGASVVGPGHPRDCEAKRRPPPGRRPSPYSLTSRNAAISQSSSELVEEAFFSDHRQPPPTKGGTDESRRATQRSLVCRVTRAGATSENCSSTHSGRTPVKLRAKRKPGLLGVPALSHLALEFSVSRLARLVCDDLTRCDLGWVRKQGG